MKSPLILAIDTSCDETAVAVTQGTTVLSNAIASQIELHKQYGGVFPTVAKQAHLQNIDPTIKAALKRAGKTKQDINAVAVTLGPGLAPALEIGIQKAKELSKKLRIPLIPINHIEGHILSVLGEPNPRAVTSKVKTHHSSLTPPQFPALAVVVSGGHTEFVLVERPGKYKKLGMTLDDAAGECLDKVGRLLGLGYPAGSLVEKLARKGNPTVFPFPLPMTASGDFNMSFSGIKTHSRRHIAQLEKDHALTASTVADFCASLQQGVFRHLIHKLAKVLEAVPARELWLGGGVAANQALRKKLRTLARKHHLTFRSPYSVKLCGDNAAMIGVAAFFRYQADFSAHSGLAPQAHHQKPAPFLHSEPQLGSSLSLDRKPRWNIEDVSAGSMKR